ncbi:MAG: hypothetical protein R8G01_22025 [Ilumatobacteraceae bacterium]|nr:hypothetical protein [Ilumatobacteraceae bacterium]
MAPTAEQDVMEDVLKRLAESPGFINGTVAWSTNTQFGKFGRSMFLFETRAEAQAGLDRLLGEILNGSPMDLELPEVCEVVAHV